MLLAYIRSIERNCLRHCAAIRQYLRMATLSNCRASASLHQPSHLWHIHCYHQRRFVRIATRSSDAARYATIAVHCATDACCHMYCDAQYNDANGDTTSIGANIAVERGLMCYHHMFTNIRNGTSHLKIS